MALYGAAGVLVAGGLYLAMHSSGSVNTPTSPGGWGQQHGAFRQAAGQWPRRRLAAVHLLFCA